RGGHPPTALVPGRRTLSGAVEGPGRRRGGGPVAAAGHTGQRPGGRGEDIRGEMMRNHWIQNLAECTEFRQTLQARPARITHGTALLLAGLLGGGLLWAGLTRVNLVVRAVGRVRPVTPPIKVYNTGSGETFSASFGGRVIAVNFREGDKVRKGDV